MSEVVKQSPSQSIVSTPTQEPKAKISYPILFWLFFIGSILGFFLEGLWSLLWDGHWINHSATVWGPFCIIYGLGGVAAYLLSVPLKDQNPLVQFFVFSLSGTVVEYLGSLFQELCFGSVSWDYSDQPFNLQGRVCLQMAVLWGLLGLAFVRLLFPWLNRFFAKRTGKGWNIACAVLSVFMAVNLLVTSLAVMRWEERLQGVARETPAAQWLDENYDNQTMEAIFSNMEFLEN